MNRLAVILVVVTLFSAGCGSNDETTPAVTSTTTTVEAAAPSTTTTLVEAEATSITVVFDGESCSYRGPAKASPTETLGVELQNTSDVTILLLIVEFGDEVTAAMTAVIGESFSDTNDLMGARPASVGVELRAEPGATATRDIQLLPATWTAVCERLEPSLRVWSAGIIESS